MLAWLLGEPGSDALVQAFVECDLAAAETCDDRVVLALDRRVRVRRSARSLGLDVAPTD